MSHLPKIAAQPGSTNAQGSVSTSGAVQHTSNSKEENSQVEEEGGKTKEETKNAIITRKATVSGPRKSDDENQGKNLLRESSRRKP